MKRSRKRVPEETRFWQKVNKTPNCWLWTASLNRGYGQMASGVPGNGPILAHRFAYEMLRGPIPPGRQIDHLCRNRACVNPDHLQPVTQQMNMRRGLQSRLMNGMDNKCVNGHEYTPENTYRNPNNPLDVRCRECSRIRDRIRRAKKNKDDKWH